MTSHFEFLLSAVYDGPTRLDHPAHRADVRKSGLSDETIRRQMFTDVPPDAYAGLLGFDPPKVVSAYLLPFADPRGGWMDHVRMKIFPPLVTKKGLIKYLQPRRSGCRLYVPLGTRDRALHGDEPLWAVEGEKKSLAVSQLGLAAVGFCGIEGWHLTGSRALLPDFDAIRLRGRPVRLLPDGDVQTNPAVHRGARQLAEALEGRGARVEIVMLPVETVAA